MIKRDTMQTAILKDCYRSDYTNNRKIGFDVKKKILTNITAPKSKCSKPVTETSLLCSKERVYSRGSQRRRRWDGGQASNPSPSRRTEQVFCNHSGWDYIHVDEKGRETCDSSWGKMECVHWANIYVTYVPCSL